MHILINTHTIPPTKFKYVVRKLVIYIMSFIFTATLPLRLHCASAAQDPALGLYNIRKSCIVTYKIFM